MKFISEFIKRLKKKKKVPEDSVRFRVSVLLTVMTAIIAVLSREEWPAIGIPVIIFTLTGYYVSYVRRAKKNTWLKVLLSLFMIVTFFNFLRDLRTTPYDPRMPLANLLLLLQTLHSYDLPTRRDLSYSLLVGLVLIAVASVLSIDAQIIIYYVLFAVFASASLFYSNYSHYSRDIENRPEPKTGMILRTAGWSAAVMAVIAILVFLFIPRFEGLVFRPLPRSWVIRLPNLTKGRIENPGQEPGEDLKKKSGRELQWRSDSYFGFNTFVNLNFRGRLSNEVVMKVQSNRWAYLRGLVFDRYNGGGWDISQPEDEIEERKAMNPPLRIPLEPEIVQYYEDTEDIIQIYNIRREMPNIVFGAYNVYQLYFPSENIYTDVNGGIRSPYLLEKGMVYSTMSKFNPLKPKDVRRIERLNKYMREKNIDFYSANSYLSYLRKKYTQLPEDFPPRVKALAERVIRDRVGEDASDLRKATALSQYLRANYPYDLDIPPFPDDRDSVDYFLFEQKRGYCEHFASALVVMLRSRGIPARFVTGYLPGDYNPVSGFYSVKMSDAHAWVEVYIPGFGWHAIDPTPGFSQSTYDSRRNRVRWLFKDLLNWFKKMLGLNNVQLPLLNKDSSIFEKILGYVIAIISLAVLIFLAHSVIVYLKYRKTGEKIEKKMDFLTWMGKRVSNIMTKAGAALSVYTTRKEEHPAMGIYRKMLKEFDRKGLKKSDSQTAREFLTGPVPLNLFHQAREVVTAFESARYSPHPPDEGQLEELEKKWNLLREEIRKYRPEKA